MVAGMPLSITGRFIIFVDCVRNWSKKGYGFAPREIQKLFSTLWPIGEQEPYRVSTVCLLWASTIGWRSVYFWLVITPGSSRSITCSRHEAWFLPLNTTKFSPIRGGVNWTFPERLWPFTYAWVTSQRLML